MGRRQYQSLVDVVYAVPVTVDIGNAATGSGTFAVGSAAVPGAQVGDHVQVFNQAGAYTDGAPVFGDVDTAGSVQLTVLNNSAGAVDYTSRVYKILVTRAMF